MLRRCQVARRVNFQLHEWQLSPDENTHKHDIGPTGNSTFQSRQSDSLRTTIPTSTANDISLTRLLSHHENLDSLVPAKSRGRETHSLSAIAIITLFFRSTSNSASYFLPLAPRAPSACVEPARSDRQ